MSSFGDINRINTNVQALDARLSLNRINKGIAENQLRMSTGLRINRAEDDAAGYSIASKLNARVAGLEQALSNVGDAKSVLDIAESSFDTVMDQLIEMKALATQAANDTLGQTERNFIASQIEALGKDINEIASQTVFQDYNLLNGSAPSNVSSFQGTFDLTFQVGERAQDTITTSISAVNIASLFTAGTGGGVEGKDAAGDVATIGNIVINTSGSMQGLFEFDDEVTSTDFRNFLAAIDKAIEGMADRVNEIGVTQSSLTLREVTLSQAITANSSAASRIMDTDFAKEQSESVRLQILQQTAISAMAQANNGPQSVLGFLG